MSMPRTLIFPLSSILDFHPRGPFLIAVLPLVGHAWRTFKIGEFVAFIYSLGSRTV